MNPHDPHAPEEVPTQLDAGAGLLRVPQETADWLGAAGLALVPRPGQVVYTPPTTAQRAAHEARQRREGAYHLTQYERGEITAEERDRIQQQARLERRRRRSLARRSQRRGLTS